MPFHALSDRRWARGSMVYFAIIDGAEEVVVCRTRHASGLRSEPEAPQE
jgi:hypothetical protein